MAGWTIRLDGGDAENKALPDKALIGGKGWSIARMAALGLTVPPAFVITTRACSAYQACGDFPDGLSAEIAEGIAWLEETTGRRYGAGPSPLLVSVRSGAAISMPGMMDTVLNMGITVETEMALGAECGDPAFARDTHRRFHELYATIVLKADAGDLSPHGDPADWAAQVERAAGIPIPDDPVDRLHAAVRAVFDSWNSRRAKRYRKHHDIPDDLGTAVTIQAMVFGNLGKTSGTGVLFSRNPISGERIPYGEYLACAQGEDVVSGRFTPQPLDAMQALAPGAHTALLKASDTLEAAGGDVQDIEFTVQDGTLFLLQSRAAKRAPAAAVRFAVDMVDEGLIDRQTALSRVSADQIRSLLAPRLTEETAAAAIVATRGEAACPGIGIGTIVTDTDEAERRAAAGEDIILARATTSPEDLHGMIVARAVVTEQGGATSHAAVVSRALGVPCVVGCGDGAVTALAGETMTVDGSAGAIYEGSLPVEDPDEAALSDLRILTEWADALSPLRVVAPEDLDEDGQSDLLDLNRIDGGEDPDRLPALLNGARLATGGALSTDAGIKAAVHAGLEAVVGRPRLPLLLAAFNAGKPPEDRETVAVSASA